MAKSKRKQTPKSVMKLPDLEQSRSAILNSLTSPSSQRTCDHAIREFIECYCSEPRLAFNQTVVTRHRISLEQHHYASTTINLRLAAVRRLAYKAGSTWGAGFSPKVIWAVVKEKAKVCEIPSLAPHDLRRTCARLCHQAGGELDQIQFLLG